MLDYEISRNTRRCALTDRELRAGEVCYSALVREGVEIRRKDYSTEAWTGPPEGSVGWWKNAVGEGPKRTTWAPNEVMLQYFESLADDPTAEDVRYVLALLLVRRRVWRLEREEQDLGGREVQVLFSPQQDCEITIPVVLPTEERAAAIQAQLGQLLQRPS